MHAKLPASKHLDYVDGWRAVAAIWVVMNHCWYMVETHLHGVTRSLSMIFSDARMSVDVFIVLSGFCLMLPVLRNGNVLRGGMWEFMKRRAWRILPPYYAAMAFSLVLIWALIHQPTGTIWDESLPVTPHGIVTHALLLHDAFLPGTDDSINYVFWSIAVEWRIYFFFPLLVVGWRYWGPLKTIFAAFVASWVLRIICTHTISVPLTINFLGLFAGGMLAAGIAYPNSTHLARGQKLPWSRITAVLSCLLVALYWEPVVHTYIRDYVVGLWAMSAILMTSVHRDAWHHRFLGSRPMVFIGTFAYSIYLIHAPLLQILWQYVFVPLQPHPLAMMAALFFPGIPAILGVSYVFFLLCERPFLRKRTRATAIPVPVQEMDLEETVPVITHLG